MLDLELSSYGIDCTDTSSWDYDFHLGQEPDILEKTSVNAESCIQVLKFMISKADDEILELEDDLAILQSQLKWVKHDDHGMLYQVLTAVFQEKIASLSSSIQDRENEEVKLEHNLTVQAPGLLKPAERIYRIISDLLGDYCSPNTGQVRKVYIETMLNCDSRNTDEGKFTSGKDGSSYSLEPEEMQEESASMNPSEESRTAHLSPSNNFGEVHEQNPAGPSFTANLFEGLEEEDLKNERSVELSRTIDEGSKPRTTMCTINYSTDVRSMRKLSVRGKGRDGIDRNKVTRKRKSAVVNSILKSGENEAHPRKADMASKIVDPSDVSESDIDNFVKKLEGLENDKKSRSAAKKRYRKTETAEGVKVAKTKKRSSSNLSIWSAEKLRDIGDSGSDLTQFVEGKEAPAKVGKTETGKRVKVTKSKRRSSSNMYVWSGGKKLKDIGDSRSDFTMHFDEGREVSVRPDDVKLLECKNDCDEVPLATLIAYSQISRNRKNQQSDLLHAGETEVSIPQVQKLQNGSTNRMQKATNGDTVVEEELAMNVYCPDDKTTEDSLEMTVYCPDDNTTEEDLAMTLYCSDDKTKEEDLAMTLFYPGDGNDNWSLDLGRMTVKALRNLAKGFGVKKPYKLNKPSLIKELMSRLYGPL